MAIEEARDKMAKAVDHVRSEFANVRTGRAAPALVENIVGRLLRHQMPLRQLAGFSVPDAMLLVISPYDKSSLGAIEKAIQTSDLGINPSNDGTVMRLSFPPLTEERRKELVKVVRHKAEEGTGGHAQPAAGQPGTSSRPWRRTGPSPRTSSSGSRRRSRRSPTSRWLRSSSSCPTRRRSCSRSERSHMDDQHNGEDEPTAPASGRVRIVGAEPAGSILEPTGDEPETAGDAAAATAEETTPLEVGGSELPHWTEAPTGEVPSVLSRGPAEEVDDADPWSSMPGPTWREEDTDWEAHEETFEPAMLAHDDDRSADIGTNHDDVDVRTLRADRERAASMPQTNGGIALAGTRRELGRIRRQLRCTATESKQNEHDPGGQVLPVREHVHDRGDLNTSMNAKATRSAPSSPSMTGASVVRTAVAFVALEIVERHQAVRAQRVEHGENERSGVTCRKSRRPRPRRSPRMKRRTPRSRANRCAL